MAKEIERKYLINTAAWVPQGAGTHFKQGYLNAQKERVVRVRIEGAMAKLTIKGITTGVTRAEFEYLIPVEDAAILLDNLCEQPLIDKHRHKEVHGGKTWEIDVFMARTRAWWWPRSSWPRRTRRSSSPPGSARKSPATPATSTPTS